MTQCSLGWSLLQVTQFSNSLWFSFECKHRGSMSLPPVCVSSPICPALMRYRTTHNLFLKVNRILLCMFTKVNWAYGHIKGISGKSGPRTYQTHKNKEGRSILTRTLESLLSCTVKATVSTSLSSGYQLCVTWCWEQRYSPTLLSSAVSRVP